MILTISSVFALGVTALQLGGLGLTSLEVQRSAQMAADAASATPTSFTPAQPACWSTAAGFRDPAAFSGAPVCRSIIDNLGTMKVANTNVEVTRAHDQVHVTITYRAPVTSPLLRLLLGDTFTTTQDAWSR